MTTARKQASIERRNQILDAALEVFASKGFGHATNKDIATAAGIKSPGLIYHYFEDQEALLKAVMQERTPVVQFTEMDVEVIFSLPPEQVLRMFASKLVEIMSDSNSQALIRIFFGEAIRKPEMINLFWDGASVHILGFLYQYFERLMDDGLMRRMDLGATVRSFLGPFFAYMVSSYIVHVPDPHTPSPEAMVETVVAVFWQGVQP